MTYLTQFRSMKRAHSSALGTLKGDGRDIFFNPDVNNNTPETWFNRLTYQQRDPDWHKTVYASGWRTTKVVRIIDQALRTQTQPGPAYVLDTHNTGFKGDLSPQSNKEDIQKMIERIKQEFANNGINAYARYSEKPERGQYGRFYVVFNPVGVHKGAPIHYLLKLFPQLGSVVTLGDGPNDKEMLVPESFGRGDSEIPNYAILVGMRQALVDLLQGKKHASFTTEAEVPNKLKEQIEKAQTGRSSSNSAASKKVSTLWQSLKCWK